MSVFLNHLRSLNANVVSVCLVVATALYYIGTRLYQDGHVYTSQDLLDALPGTLVNPEPLEIPFYILGYVAIPVITIVLALAWTRVFGSGASPQDQAEQNSKKGLSIRVFVSVCGFGIVLLVALALIAFDRLPGADFLKDYFARNSLAHLLWLFFTKRLYVFRIALAGGLVAFAGMYLLRLPWSTYANKLKEIFESPRAKAWVPYVFIALAILLFHPNFPSEESFTNYIVSPAHETLLGKPLLYETTSVYGVLNIYTTAFLLTTVLPMTYQGFSVIIMVCYFLFFAGLYKVLRWWFASPGFAIFGVWCAVVLGFLLLNDPTITAYNYPGQGAFRQGFYLLTLFCFARFWITRSKAWRELTLAAVGFSVFWNIDTGIYVALATCAAFVSIELFTFELAWSSRIRRSIGIALRELVYVVFVFGVINLINFWTYGSWPNWALEIRDISTFNGGFARFPIPAFGIFYFHVIVYSGFALWIMKRLIHKQGAHPIVVFFTVYGMCSLIYYIGTSAWSYLNFVSIPAVLLSLYALFFFLKEGRGVFSARFVLSAFSGAVVFFSILSLAKIPTVFAYRDYGNLKSFYLYDSDRDLYEDAQDIKNHFEDIQIPIFHHNDGKLLLMAGKVNSFYLQENDKRLYSLYDNYLIVFKRQMQGLKNQVDEAKPDFIFIANTAVDSHIPEFEEFVKRRGYTVETRLRTLNIYKRPL